MLELDLLGPVVLARAGERIQLPRRKTEALCAFLVLHPEPHMREKLAALFWGDVPDDKARNSLRGELAALRKLVDPALLLTDRETVQWNPDVPIRVDVRQVQQELRALMEGAESSVDRLACAPNLLPDFYDDWVLAEREQLRVQYCDTLLHHVQRLRAASEYARAGEFARRVLQADPANERAHQHLMFCFVQMGDRAAALKQYDACVNALRAELDVEPSADTTALYEWLKQAGTPRSLAAQLTNLPIPLTSFVGRQRETAELKQLLRGDAYMPRARLVTLTGAGGSGKTRLAIQTATDLTDAYRDGVWWTELAPQHDAALVAQAVAQALGIQEQADEALSSTLVRVLRERELLLVLDNCEHLTAACAVLAYALLTQCPALQILATSRESLNVPGEVVRVVPLLSIPELNHAAVPHVSGKVAELAMGFESVRLFVERALAVHAAFQLTEENTPHVVEICRRLDGIPLALELAAARVRIMSPAQIAARLNARLDVLNGGTRTALPRQQSLRALIDWSYDLLPDAERRVFETVSVFAGGWTLDAAVYVCASAGEMETLDTLARLADKSLILVNGDGTRYTMLETIREYAVEKSRLSRQHAESQTRHALYFLELAKQGEASYFGKRMAEIFRRFDLEHDNFRAALRFWLEENDTAEAHALGARVAGALGTYWHFRGEGHECEMWTRRALEGDVSRMEPETRARLYVSMGTLYWHRAEFFEALDWHRRAVADFRQAQILPGEIFALNNLAVGYGELGQWDESQRTFDEAFRLAETQPDPLWCAVVLMNRNTVELLQGKPPTEAIHSEALHYARLAGSNLLEAMNLGNLGDWMRSQGNYPEALRLLEQALELAKGLDDAEFNIALMWMKGLTLVESGQAALALPLQRQGVRIACRTGYWYVFTRLLEGIGRAYTQLGHLEAAAQILSAADAYLQATHAPMPQDEAASLEQALATLRETLGAARFEELWQGAHTLSRAESMALALDERLAAQVET